MYRLKTLPVAIAFASVMIVASPVQADMNQKMAGVFDGMVSTSPAGSWETQTRGVVSGGGFRVRTPIVEEQPFNFQMPSADASCGGIDMFAGSFSYINTDQLIELGRAIMSNAKNYAFKLALGVVSNKIQAQLQQLEDVMQKLNEMSMNSCEWGKGLVNAGVEAAESALNKEFGLELQDSSAVDGFIDTLTGIGDGAQAEETMKTEKPDEYAELVGNVVYNALKDAGVGNWNWVGGGSEKANIELVLSLTGTYIIGEAGSEGEREIEPVAATLKFYDFVYGSESNDVELLSCDNSNCTSMGDSPATNVKGIATHIKDAFIGDGATPGIIDYYGSMHSATQTISDEHKSIMTSMPHEFGAYVARIASVSENEAKTFVIKHAGALAYVTADQMVREIFGAARSAVNMSKSSFKTQALDVLDASARDIHDQKQTIQSEGGLADMAADYERIKERLDLLPLTSSISGSPQNSSR
nr:conjugal transfer protein TraH [uncultured Halomonas sp.]